MQKNDGTKRASASRMRLHLDTGSDELRMHLETVKNPQFELQRLAHFGLMVERKFMTNFAAMAQPPAMPIQPALPVEADVSQKDATQDKPAAEPVAKTGAEILAEMGLGPDSAFLNPPPTL